MKQWQITDVSELAPVANEIVDVVDVSSEAAVLALHGDLGAGKTTFVQTLAKELGVDDVVTSPTFVIMKLYGANNESIESLAHIDAYRIEDNDEMRVLGFASLLKQPGVLICIEWAERITELLPASTHHLKFALEGEQRLITYEHE